MTQAALTPAAGRGRARWGRRGPARGARGPASPAASAFPTAVPRETPGATGPLSLDPESPWPTLSVSLHAPTLRTAPALRSAALREPLRTPGSPRGTHPPCTRSAVPQASPSDPAAPSTPSTPSTPFAWERRGGAGAAGRGRGTLAAGRLQGAALDEGAPGGSSRHHQSPLQSGAAPAGLSSQCLLLKAGSLLESGYCVKKSSGQESAAVALCPEGALCSGPCASCLCAKPGA